jgi:hypothetical protein
MPKIIELNIKCPCGFMGWIKQEPIDPHEEHFRGYEPPTTYCPECSGDTWEEIDFRIKEEQLRATNI